MYGFLLECGGFTKCYTVRENQHALFQQLLRADSSSDRADTSCSPPLFMLYFICFDSVHVITNAVSSYVQLPCCVQKIQFPCSHPLSLALRLFLPPLLHRFLAIDRKGLKKTCCLGLSAPIFHCQCIVKVCVCVLIIINCKKKNLCDES